MFKRTWIILFVAMLLWTSYGYYARNLLVNNDFLDTIVVQIKYLEEARVSQSKYDLVSDQNISSVINSGHMIFKSNRASEIAVSILVMSDLLLKRDSDSLACDINGKEALIEKYLEELKKLEVLLEPYRKTNQKVESLWETGIFK